MKFPHSFGSSDRLHGQNQVKGDPLVADFNFEKEKQENMKMGHLWSGGCIFSRVRGRLQVRGPSFGAAPLNISGANCTRLQNPQRTPSHNWPLNSFVNAKPDMTLGRYYLIKLASNVTGETESQYICNFCHKRLLHWLHGDSLKFYV